MGGERRGERLALSLPTPMTLTASPPFPASHESLDVRNPLRMAECMMLIALRRRATFVLRCDAGEENRLELLRGSQSLGCYLVDAGLATATIARFAAFAELDLLQVASGTAQLARFRVVIDGDEIEFLVSVGPALDGLDFELRPLAVKGKALEASPRHQLKRCPACDAFTTWNAEVCERDGAVLVELGDRAERGGTIGSYVVGEVLGTGGTGTVYAAEHALIGTRVAIKVIKDSFTTSPSRGQLFLREARATSRVRDPGIISVIDFGLLGDGRPYLVMERIEGEPLDDKLVRGGALEPRTALLLARAVARALSAAHQSGVVHLDLKPSNVILLAGSTDLEPRIKVIDFGSANRVGESTCDGQSNVSGTPEYMSPEHALGEPADRRSDIYALGVMLFEMLSGALPFHAATGHDLMIAQIQKAPPTVTSPHGTLPQAVARIVARALRKKVDERHQTMPELILDLESAIEVLDRAPWRQWMAS